MTLHVARIARLLTQARAAQHEHEKTQPQGRGEPAWEDWSAKFLIEQGVQDILGAPVTSGQLRESLVQATESHRKEQTGLGWAEYAAAKLVETFTTVPKA